MLRKIFDFLLQRFHLDGHRKEALACHYHKTCDNIFCREAVFHARRAKPEGCGRQ